MEPDQIVDSKYYTAVPPRSIGERLLILARDQIYSDFLKYTRPSIDSAILDVGVSDVVGDAANVLERKYPYPERITAVGLGNASEFQAVFPKISYLRIVAGQPLPFADQSFDVATSNAVLEHVGSVRAQHRFIGELIRVARRIFISVPNRFFPIEHHTAIPFFHWWDSSFRLGCWILNKSEWTNPTNLILMSSKKLQALVPKGTTARIDRSGIRLGGFSSNLFLYLERIE
ncbi:MAG TPA: class I SAM-dependent methyltransferase [Methylocella sp.]|nr:class I SAM-dependent methyltransferase [Methylocella sp.]